MATAVHEKADYNTSIFNKITEKSISFLKVVPHNGCNDVVLTLCSLYSLNRNIK